MVKPVSQDKKRCPAMIEAGIEDPDSPEGALFCAGTRDGMVKSRCPYPEGCIVFEAGKTEAQSRREAMAIEARKMCSVDKLTLKEISDKLGLSPRTIMRYLQGENQ